MKITVGHFLQSSPRLLLHTLILSFRVHPESARGRHSTVCTSHSHSGIWLTSRLVTLNFFWNHRSVCLKAVVAFRMASICLKTSDSSVCDQDAGLNQKPDPTEPGSVSSCTQLLGFLQTFQSGIFISKWVVQSLPWMLESGMARMGLHS